jgi:hypothetical protein
LEAWLKYRPSVEIAAFVNETTAVPAEPENPEMNSAVVVSMRAGDNAFFVRTGLF